MLHSTPHETWKARNKKTSSTGSWIDQATVTSSGMRFGGSKGRTHENWLREFSHNRNNRKKHKQTKARSILVQFKPSKKDPSAISTGMPIAVFAVFKTPVGFHRRLYYPGWFQTWLQQFPCSMGCHLKPIDFYSIILQDGHIAPPTRYFSHCYSIIIPLLSHYYPY